MTVELILENFCHKQTICLATSEGVCVFINFEVTHIHTCKHISNIYTIDNMKWLICNIWNHQAPSPTAEKGGCCVQSETTWTSPRTSSVSTPTSNSKFSVHSKPKQRTWTIFSTQPSSVREKPSRSVRLSICTSFFIFDSLCAYWRILKFKYSRSEKKRVRSKKRIAHLLPKGMLPLKCRILHLHRRKCRLLLRVCLTSRVLCGWAMSMRYVNVA